MEENNNHQHFEILNSDEKDIDKFQNSNDLFQNMNIDSQKLPVIYFDDLIWFNIFFYFFILTLLLIFHFFSHSILSLTFVIVFSFIIIFTLLTLFFKFSIYQISLWFFIITLFLEIYNHFILFLCAFFILILSNIHLSIKVIASELEQWNSYFGHAASYNVLFYGLIALAPIIISSTFIYFILQSTILHTTEKQVLNPGAIYDRFLLTNIFWQGLFVLDFAFILQFRATWNSLPFVIILIITIAVTFVGLLCFLYFGSKRKLHQKSDKTDSYLYKAALGLGIIHVILFIFVWIYHTNLYAKNLMVFSSNYDSGFIKKYFNEEKYYFTGGYETMFDCPKKMTVLNWEDNMNPYGCLNLKAYNKVKIVTSLLFDIILQLPLFDLVVLFILYIDNDDTNNNVNDMKGSTYSQGRIIEKVLYGIDYCLVLIVLIYIIFAFCYQFTSVASYLTMPMERSDIDNLQFINHIIPPSMTNYDLDYDIEYVISGKLVYEANIEVTLILKALGSKGDDISILIKTNEPFEISSLYAYKNNVPTEYSMMITSENRNIKLGNIKIGGLISGKFIQLGDFPLLIQNDPSIIKATIKGHINEADDITSGIKETTIYLIKGFTIIPSTQSDILSSNKEFTPTYFAYSTTSDSDGLFDLTDIPQGTYTILIVNVDYYIEVSYVSITQSNQLIELKCVLVPRLNISKVRITLQWANLPIDLDLTIALVSDSTTQCYVGYMNKVCANVELMTQSKSGGDEGIEMLEIGYLSNYSYEVYVNKYMNKHEGYITENFAPGFMTEDEVTDNDKINLSQSNAKVKIYVPEYKFALLNADVPRSVKGNEWKVFRMNGLKGIGEISKY